MSENPDFKNTVLAALDVPYDQVRAPSTKVAAVSRRTGHCTHQKVTRLYDRHGDEKCPLCHRYPAFGWLYRCTQDSQGMLPVSEFSKPHTESFNKTANSQLEDITDQFVRVDANASPDLTKEILSEKESVVVESSATDCNDVIHNKHCQSHSADSTPVRYSSSEIPQSSHSACEMKVCVTCRPIYRDRSWQSLNAIVHEPLHLPSEFELLNRPASDSHLLANMNYHGSSRSYARLPAHLLGEKANLSVSACRQEGDYQIGRSTDNNQSNKSDIIPFPKMKEEIEEIGSEVNTKDKRPELATRLGYGRYRLQKFASYRISSPSSANIASGMIHDQQPIPQETVPALKNRPSSILPDNLPCHRDQPRKKITWVADTEDKEKRMGRRLSSGRFFID